MSEWINKNLFAEFVEQKTQEQEQTPAGPRRLDIIWPTPERGTPDRPKIYEGRFLPDPNGKFYMKYSYHMFYSGEKWNFLLCPKTWGMDNFCPWCSVTSKLYMGNKEDKKMAYEYKRKEKFVSNFFIQDDPRDAERNDEEKMKGTVKIYEFPGKVESKLKAEITDTRHGIGPGIFDPGEEGHTFILKVKSTKPKDGKTWPDYSDSLFARRPEALGSADEIRELMNNRYDLEEYVRSMERPEEDVINLLKAEMVWDLVKSEYERAKGLEAAAAAAPAEQEGNDVPDFEPDANTELHQEQEATDVEDQSDIDLLRELEDL